MPTKYEGVEGVSQEAPVVGGSEVVLGRLLSIDDNGRPWVAFSLGDYHGRAVALSTQPLRLQDVGRQVALLFAGGQAHNPVIMGFIHSPLTAVLHGEDNLAESPAPVDVEFSPDLALSGESIHSDQASGGELIPNSEERHNPVDDTINPPSGLLALPITHSATETRIDGKRLVFSAQEEVVIQCGEASISLSKNGKVTIRGKYVLSRASGVNRILGGSVQVN